MHKAFVPCASIHILHHRQKYSQTLARTDDAHESAAATESLVPKEGFICVIYSIYVHGWKQEADAIFMPAQACKQNWIGKYVLSVMSSLTLKRWYLFKLFFFSPELFERGKNSWLHYSLGLMLLPAAFLFPGILITAQWKN